MEMTECDPLRRAKGAGVSDPIERHSHISITRQTPVGIVHADMHITSVEISGMPGDMGDDLVGDCFDPDSCCDEHEKAMIAALRAYLRPEVAPECLLARLRDTLDGCCCEDGGNAAGAVDERDGPRNRAACTRRCGRVLRRDFGLGPCLEARQAG